MSLFKKGVFPWGLGIGGGLVGFSFFSSYIFSFSWEGKKVAYREIPLYEEEIEHLIDSYFREIPEEILKEEDSSQEKEKEVKKDKKDKRRKGSSFQIFSYRVKKGDSLWKIAEKFHIPVYTLISANPSLEKRRLQIGEKIRIPSEKGIFYRVKKGDTLKKIAKRFRVPVEKIREKNSIKGDLLRIGEEIFLPGAKPLKKITRKKRRTFLVFRWPVKGKISSGFGYRIHPITKRRDFHRGIDIVVPYGTPVRAVEDGIVVFAGKAPNYGKVVIIRHKKGYYSIYAHNSSLRVKKGKRVKKGEVLGLSGNTGRTTGAHLHFEIRKGKNPINPLRLLGRRIFG